MAWGDGEARERLCVSNFSRPADRAVTNGRERSRYNTAQMDRIGRYLVQRELGRGAMGVVYLALDPSIGRSVAIKTIRLSELADESERAKLRDRLFREAQSAGMLSHPNIVTIYDIAEEEDLTYIAMEVVEGPTLEQMLRSQPIDGKLVLSILRETAAALDYAHKRGIIHRDIKPANIIVHEGTTAKITDFGVAKIVSQQMTHAGVMIGTPSYMSPEQIHGSSISGRSDQFSLAVIAYEMLTGEKPFVADHIPALVFKIVHDTPEPVNRINSTLSWAVDTVVSRALSKDPEARYPSCSDFVFALENACRSSKGWRPMAPGISESLPTLVVPATTSGAEQEGPAPTLIASPVPIPLVAPAEVSTEAPASRPEVAPVQSADMDEVHPAASAEREVPPLLRMARVAGLVALVAGLAFVLFTAVAEYADDRNNATQEEGSGAPRPSPTAPRPPVPGGDAQRAAENAAGDLEDRTELPANESPRTTEEARASGTVRFVTDPPGVFLVVDGEDDLSCTSPCSLQLKPGRHTLAATKEDYRRTLRIFESPSSSEISMALERMTGSVFVRSNPPGAAVSVDGQRRSERTPAMLILPIGSHSIEVEHEGTRQQETVQVKDGAITNISISF